MRRRGGVLVGAAIGVLAFTATLGPVGGTPAAGAGAVDLTALPIGTAVTTEPQAGAVFSCQTTFGGGGAHAFGDWIDEDAGTFDLTAKPHVDGSVTWPFANSTSFGSTGATRIVSTNDLPEHPTGTFPIATTDDAYQFDRNPNAIRAVALNMAVPTRPGMATTPACLGLGRIGILESGSALFNGLDAMGRDAVAYEIQDQCDGHPQEAGAYHYHSISSCIDDPATGGHSERLGYAADGFGIYGHYGEDGDTLTNAALDECHGHVGLVEWDGVPRVMYHYHATWEYPYTVGCLRGTTLATALVDCNLAPPDNDFADVDPATDAAFLDAVDWTDCHGLLTGTNFRATNDLNRKNAVLLLWRFMGSPTGAPDSSYGDVPTTASYHDALDWAVDEGVYTLGSTSSFKPTKAVTRTQFAVMLWNLLGRPGGDADTSFTDVATTAWYHDALDWAVAHEVLTAYANGSIRPDATVKRKQAIAWLSALATADEVWTGYGGMSPDTLRAL